jgi:hypothetical protein
MVAVAGFMGALMLALYLSTTGQHRPVVECIKLFGECAFY